MKPPPRTCARASSELVEDARLTRRHAALRLGELDLAGRQQQRGRRRAGRAHPGGDRKSRRRRIGKLAVADPVHFPEHETRPGERGARAHQHPRGGRIEADDIKWLRRGDAEAAPLADRVMNDASMTAQHPSVDMDDVAGNRSPGQEPLDHVAVVAGRNETDVLTVGLFGVDKAVFAR